MRASSLAGPAAAAAALCAASALLSLRAVAVLRGGDGAGGRRGGARLSLRREEDDAFNPDGGAPPPRRRRQGRRRAQGGGTPTVKRRRRKKREKVRLRKEAKRLERLRQRKRERCVRGGATDEWNGIDECVERCKEGNIEECVRRRRRRREKCVELGANDLAEIEQCVEERFEWRRKKDERCRGWGATERHEVEECVERCELGGIEIEECVAGRQWREAKAPRPRPPLPEIVEHDEEIQVFDGFVAHISPLCGNGEDGTLSDDSKAALESAMLEFFNDEVECDTRTDEVITDVTIEEFVGGKECFDDSHNDGDGAATDQRNAELRLRRAMTRGLQEEREPEQRDDEEESAFDEVQEKKKKRGGRKPRMTAVRGRRVAQCKRCRKRGGVDDELTPDSGRRLLPALPALRALGERGAGAGGTAAAVTVDKDARRLGPYNDGNRDSAADSAAPHILQQPPPPPPPLPPEECSADLVSSIQEGGFPNVTNATISELRQLDCSPSSDACAAGLGCCGAPACRCADEEPPDGSACGGQNWTYPNDERGDAGFSMEVPLSIQGMCGDGPNGTLSAETTLGLEAYLVDYSNAFLLEGGCEDEMEFTNVTVVGFFEDESCRDPAVADEGSDVDVIMEGTCGESFCIDKHPFPSRHRA